MKQTIMAFQCFAKNANEIGVSYAARLAGRFAAENIGKYVKKGQLITKQSLRILKPMKKLDGVKIMSVLSANSVRGVPQSHMD